MSSTFSTPYTAVLEQDWHEILEWYCLAFNQRMAEALFKAKLAGATFR